MSVGHLAILGGDPEFDGMVHVGRPNIGDRARFHELVDEMFDRNWLTNDGPFVKSFERKIEQVSGAKHAIAVANATLGLEMAMQCLNLSGEVICPSFTFVATVHAIRRCGLEPVFVDVCAENHLLDPALVEAAITKNTAAILAVHTWGQPCQIEALEKIAVRYGIPLIFDAAHAFACKMDGLPFGGRGTVSAYSFHATKFFSTFEGGAITTDDDRLADQLRLYRNFGFAGFDHVICEGTNAKMTEVAAAMGLVNLDAIDSFIEHNRANREAYKTALRDYAYLEVVGLNNEEDSNLQYVPVIFATHELRDFMLEGLWAENVRARRYFYPGCHQMAPYSHNELRFPLPNTEDISNRILILPTGSSLAPEAVIRICKLIDRLHDLHCERAIVLKAA